MSDEQDVRIKEIEERVDGVQRVLPPPWYASLETRHGIGGESFVASGAGDVDREIYANIVLGHQTLRSPDARIDLFLDFVANAMSDIPYLISEIRRLREKLPKP